MVGASLRVGLLEAISAWVAVLVALSGVSAVGVVVADHRRHRTRHPRLGPTGTTPRASTAASTTSHPTNTKPPTLNQQPTTTRQKTTTFSLHKTQYESCRWRQGGLAVRFCWTQWSGYGRECVWRLILGSCRTSFGRRRPVSCEFWAEGIGGDHFVVLGSIASSNRNILEDGLSFGNNVPLATW